MTKALIFASLGLLLTACSRDDMAAGADNRILCSFEGQAFQVRPHVGDTSFVIRLADADSQCAKGENT